ncbi:MAG: hypothetical protein J3Q66DRAFT_277932, partial [Benniella sp.]
AICTSPQCVLTAASIMSDMNPQADPCEDFSAYTCMSHILYHCQVASFESLGIDSIIFAADLSTSNVSESAQRNMQKLKDLYTSCMDEEQIAKAGRQPIVGEVQKLLDMFPVSNGILSTAQTLDPSQRSASKIDRTALSMTLAHLNRLGLDSFGSISVSTDSKNPTKRVLELTEGGLGLPSKEYYLDERIMGIYEATVGKMLHLILGDNIATTGPGAESTKTTESTKWDAIAKDIVEFEKELAAASTDVSGLRDSEKTCNPRSLDQISLMTPSVDWPLVLQNTPPAGVNISQPMIIVTSPSFQENLESLLQRTSLKTLQNHLVWNLIRQLAGSLALPYYQPLRELNAALTGVSADVVPDRWKHCVSVVNRHLDDMAGQYFVEESFKGESRNQVYSMIETLRESYLKAFPTLEWLDDATTTEAIKKMKAIVQLIGFSTDSPNVASSDSLDEYFSGYKVQPGDYFGNQMRVSQWSPDKAFRELNQSVNMLKMHMVPQTVNAYYSPTQNQIVFPAGILQPPFFHTENPEYINYGGIGVVAGHEITARTWSLPILSSDCHGFDNKGHLFDSEGRMVNWWTDATTEAFNTKARCFVEQYGNFSVKGSDGKAYYVKGQLTLGENIADNGGLKQSFEGMRFFFCRHTFSDLILLDNLTAEQLFFISYARPWCSKRRPESAIRQTRTDPHTPAKWRINGAVQNSAGFAKAFQCAAGTPMNPVILSCHMHRDWWLCVCVCVREDNRRRSSQRSYWCIVPPCMLLILAAT